ncbi:hypothetical protein ACEPAF_6081 [Sanghuangporus sanghuang]|uniref:Tetraspanin Tsp2 n=1 Tax=Sanghuangporus baumii TaxID=108892 RepID=A0A9Q5I5R1_SANBA|nr:hypothetical protein A7U60_g702 [Sanghuangporus baumii]
MSARPRRPPSLSSSVASSQQHILLQRQPDMLEPPNVPFLPNAAARPVSDIPSVVSSTASLSVNYVPNKFSLIASPGLQKRRSTVKGPSGKTGGGREAFRSNEARMPDANDDDYDGVDNIKLSQMRPKLRWNRFKWILFISNFVVSVYSLVCLIFCILTWLNVWHHADIVRVGNKTELAISTIAAIIGVVTSLLGWAGILLNNRGFLAVYTFLLWVLFAFICAPGYITYKKRTFNLEGKINAQWSRDLGMNGRARIQNQLHCCGYYSPFVEASVTNTCYARSVLPGCKNPYLKFERMALGRWYAVAFGLVPVQLLAILAALLCSNHVTYRWGKGMMPKAYRLDMSSMALIIDNYANQLADRLGRHGSSSGLSIPPVYSAPVLNVAAPAYGSDDYGRKM